MTINADDYKLIEIKSNNENMESVQAICEHGNGIMRIFQIFDGIYLSYNDFHTLEVESKYKATKKIFCLDFCKEGCIEQNITKNRRIYTKSNDIRIDTLGDHSGNFYFPLSHYHGLTLSFELEEASNSLGNFLEENDLELKKIQEKFCINNMPYFIHKNDELNKLFLKFYELPKSNKKLYMKIITIEILIFLDSLQFDIENDNKEYFYKSVTQKIKKIYKLITTDLQHHYTIESLASKYSLSQTTLKKAFKEMYGDPINTFLKKYKLNKARDLLITSDMKIESIAFSIGYKSPGKFSMSFKKQIGLTPIEYRSQYYDKK